MASIFDVSSRTKTKILKRLNIGCSNCGWNEATCDIHHIIEKSKGGTDDHENLTYLCPNCHRLAHNKKLTKFMTLKEQVGDEWLKLYYPELANKVAKSQSSEKRKDREQVRLEKQKKVELQKEKVLGSSVDFSKYGWIQEVSLILGISPQKVSSWMNRNIKDFYDEKCFKRKTQESLQIDMFHDGSLVQ